MTSAVAKHSPWFRPIDDEPRTQEIPVNIPAPAPEWLPGHEHIVGMGTQDNHLHRLDENLAPLDDDGLKLWFGHCGAFVEPLAAPPFGWPWCPNCWDLTALPQRPPEIEQTTVMPAITDAQPGR